VYIWRREMGVVGVSSYPYPKLPSFSSNPLQNPSKMSGRGIREIYAYQKDSRIHWW
jgi:hypothetical protein